MQRLQRGRALLCCLRTFPIVSQLAQGLACMQMILFVLVKDGGLIRVPHECEKDKRAESINSYLSQSLSCFIYLIYGVFLTLSRSQFSNMFIICRNNPTAHH